MNISIENYLSYLYSLFHSEAFYHFFAFTAVVIIAQLWIVKYIKRKTRYDEKRNSLILDDLRAYFEDKMYAANEKLMSDPERWKSINGTVLAANNSILDNSSHNNFRDDNFLKNMGVDTNSIKIDKDKVFVLTPYHVRFARVYRKVKNICMKLDLQCVRGDEQYVKGSVLGYIIHEMLSSAIVIANIDGRNPNVFYELGIAHALDKMVIIIAAIDKIGSVPFDVKSQGIVIWENFQELDLKLTKALKIAKQKNKKYLQAGRNSDQMTALNG